ncbi:ScyD/ScyE family protein [Streptomyces laculatispora]|uniref:ScyD/ScyE family protein n=1 Tax=Streptomyces laculatispora TaxID=887464 RepID=UPI001A943770|nr:ScyD/ScyE family protein [Streptomyces laculatispora]MBO0915576.1 ScyD/ScyE family protein [Streptomyces laculatispora]
MSTVVATAIPGQAAAAHGWSVKARAEVVASGLHNPRDVQVQADGSLLVLESGSGPATPCPPPAEQGRNRCLGFSGSLYRVAGSQKGRVVTGLPSEQINQNYGTSVLTRVGGAVQAEAVGNGSYRISYGLSGLPSDRAGLGAGSGPLGTLSSTSGAVLGDLAVHELEHNPDAGNPGVTEVFSNPWGFAKDGKDFLATDAGANDLIRIHPDGSTETVFAFPTNAQPTDNTPLQAVPTGILRGRDGAFYIADMSGMYQGLSRIWRYVPGSTPTVFATGLTDVIDLAVAPSGDLIALSYGSGEATDPGPGTLTRINAHTGATTPIPTTTPLTEPTGVAVTAKGDIYVTSNTQSNTDGVLLKFPAA